MLGRFKMLRQNRRVLVNNGGLAVTLTDLSMELNTPTMAGRVGKDIETLHFGEIDGIQGIWFE